MGAAVWTIDKRKVRGIFIRYWLSFGGLSGTHGGEGGGARSGKHSSREAMMGTKDEDKIPCLRRRYRRDGSGMRLHDSESG